ncbi:MAG: hypothetical protein HN348_25950 [Proteobacteria bacterium]|jgi:regulator of protease activity HflC (stomatin/prohibitin superfamily)|nr:hypothetical protein [Pseudomonadota bacterium]
MLLTGILLAVGVVIALGGLSLIMMVEIGRPDEWVLRLRNGRLIDAGQGMALVKMPWDRIVRFTAAMQRVSFVAHALTCESLSVSIEGFVLWSVSAKEDGPFTAFTKLGIVDTREVSALDKNQKHLLQRAQYRAFQQLLCAAVQRHTSKYTLDGLLTDQDTYVARLNEEISGLTDHMGVHIEGLQILQVQPRELEMLRQRSARLEEASREKAAKIRLETNERIGLLELESKRRVEEQDKRLAQERAHHRHELNMKLETHKAEVQGVELARKERSFADKMSRRLRTAQTRKEAMLIINEAEEAKSPEVRNYELARLATIKTTEAFTTLPLNNAQWVTVGDQSPMASLASLIVAGKSIFNPSLADSDRER